MCGQVVLFGGQGVTSRLALCAMSVLLAGVGAGFRLAKVDRRLSCSDHRRRPGNLRRGSSERRSWIPAPAWRRWWSRGSRT